MSSNTISCPQCGAPLPRQALWRSVLCGYCGAEVTRAERIVKRARFREAFQRTRAGIDADTILCAGQHYRVIKPVASGSSARVLLAERAGPFPERAILKIAHEGSTPGRLRQEHRVLTELQSDGAAGSAYFSQLLPQVVAFGMAHDATGEPREALVLRNPTGFWGSLADVWHNYPGGVDPRHAVWMWRRALDVLGHVHARGWVHGRLGPEHWLVHPGDHGIRLAGWAGARRLHDAGARARDLVQSAWTMRLLLAGAGGDAEPAIPASTPRPLAALLQRASEDPAWCARVGAQGLSNEVAAAAEAAFGAPKFVHFTPAP